ncbi:MAG: ADP-ribosylglycohydrolase family protein [Verrucomicrobiota bacterium JB025]|nr:ADP-ribosylglycohydrolase family protein [Verrucomicrobiota bacterium JB025]
MTSPDTADRLARARESLEGLSVGDAIGESLSYQYSRCREICDFSAFRPGTVRFTDDTEMALAMVETLERLGGIDGEVLAWAFSNRFRRDPDRGYGRMARHILQEIGNGTPWRDASSQAFGGGSFGNGAAMRVAPLGAYFADQLSQVPAMAAKSARVTHFHPEGIAGAVAVAVAAAVAGSQKGQPLDDAARAVWDAVLDFTPESKVRLRLSQARRFTDVDASEVAREVGNGAEISAQDTVPFCIWSACNNLGCYREAVLGTLEVGGDCDTNCAIVGGIVSAFSGASGIPADWLAAREPLPLTV